MKTLERDRSRGQILVIAALTVFLLIAFVALAVDTGITYGVRAKLNSAVDSAAVAAARATVVGSTDAVRAQNAATASSRLFRLNFDPGYLGATSNGVTTRAVHQANGMWQVTVSASATRPTFLMGVLGLQNMTVSARAQAIRRNVDMMLVIDTSGSLGPPDSPAATFGQVKSAALDFVSNFASGPGGDRVGLVVFASGARLAVPINKDATRGFDMNALTSAINALGTNGDTSPSGSTASSEGLRIAHDEIDRIDPSMQSSLRVVVFFSDGAPNDVSATFSRASGGAVTGDLYSNAPQANGPALNGNTPATSLYSNSQRDALLGSYNNIPTLPTSGFTTTAWNQGAVPIQLASYNGARSFSNWPANTSCNVNIAARNMAENVANTIRSEGIYVFTLGLGSFLNGLEARFTPNCGYRGSTEYGERILERLANVPDPADPVVRQNPDQPIGMYVWAADAGALDNAFNTIASQILRLI
jgi:Flp pilus assembly protein TadG